MRESVTLLKMFFGEGAEDGTRGRVRSPEIRNSQFEIRNSYKG
jgi:hypothetical protein